MEVTFTGVKTSKLEGFKVLRYYTTLTGLQSSVHAWERIKSGEELTVPILASFGSKEDAINELRKHFELSTKSLDNASECEAVKLLNNAKDILVRLDHVDAVAFVSDAIMSVQQKIVNDN